jgi:hypothetical protein
MLGRGSETQKNLVPPRYQAESRSYTSTGGISSDINIEKAHIYRWETRMGLRNDAMALIFGMLLIAVTFGDSHIVGKVGNLDVMFGHNLWPVIDAVYPLSLIIVFLLFGQMKGRGKLKFNVSTASVFLSFMAVLLLMIGDDFVVVLHLGEAFNSAPSAYWIVISWVFPIYSIFAFLYFGRLHETDTKA